MDRGYLTIFLFFGYIFIIVGKVYKDFSLNESVTESSKGNLLTRL